MNDRKTMTFWHDRNVLVTGCTGFVGRVLVTALVRRGAHVIGLARGRMPGLLPIAEDSAGHVTLVRGDVQDDRLVMETLGDHAVDTVFHLAGQAILSDAAADPVGTFEANIRGTWVLLDACRLNGTVARVVTASSDQVYGNQQSLPYTEEHRLASRHPYGVSKSCADLITLSYARTYGLASTVARCCNIFGPGDLNFSRLIPGTIRSALLGERPVIRSDGSPLCDFLFVGDMVEGFLALAERTTDPAVRGRVYNFGTGEPRSVLELTELILQAVGRTDLEPEVLNEASGEGKHKYLSAEAAARDLNWRPAAPILQRLSETVAWYRQQLGLAVNPVGAV